MVNDPPDQHVRVATNELVRLYHELFSKISMKKAVALTLLYVVFTY